MEVAEPTIEDVFAEFSAEEAAHTSARKAEQTEAILELLTGYLDGYAYEALSPEESKFWRSRWEQDEEAGSFCRTFGPERILPAVRPFLDWFVIRKVAGPAWITEAAGPVVSGLVDWLERHGYASPDEAKEAKDRATDATQDLPRADRLGTLLFEETEKEVTEPTLEERDLESELITISRVEPGALWVETEVGEEIGPVRVADEASKLAAVGWGISAANLIRTASGWHLVEIGNVYPNP